jgi:excinuclease ABC subunit A
MMFRIAFTMDDILITGAREHNLKNVDVRIPRNRLTVITGLSGSGKSSLAFDTLYAEGQRRYVESLSAYARQFLDQMQKPDVDHIEGLSPAIAIEQRTSGSNPRSIVATTTEIHDYLRLLYGSVGHAHCPQCHQPVRRQSAEQIVELLLALPARTKLAILAPMVRGRKGRHEDVIEAVRRLGFVRVRVNGTICELDDVPKLDKNKSHTIEAVVDRIVVGDGVRQRLTDSVETALKHGTGLLFVETIDPAGKAREIVCSEKNACPACGISFEELKPRSFSFNSPYGACPTCAGLGSQLIFDEDLIVPDKTLSLEDGAVQAWRRGGHRLILYYRHLMRSVAAAFNVDMTTPYKDMPAEFRKALIHGTGEDTIELAYWARGWKRHNKPFEGVIPNLQRRYNETDIEEVRERLRQYMSRERCPACEGARLRPESRACTVAGKSIVDVMAMSVRDADTFFSTLKLEPVEQRIAAEVLKEIRRRLRFLVDVGLDYLTLDRESATLAGGEMQRIRLATQIGSGLVGVMYVLDEPTIGLHSRDNERLIAMLRQLEQRGNTVVVVEHDAEMIREADHIIDLGPGAGRHGGEVVYQGDFAGLMRSEKSLTAAYMSGRKRITLPKRRKIKADSSWLKITGATENNLQNVDVAIPVGCFVCVTGVSGSGKSTLVDEVLRKHLARLFNGAKDRPGACKKITGTEFFDKVIEIDQSAIGRTPRSNPVTYTGAFTPMRDLFAATPSAKVRGYKPGRFSFNVKGGRCEVCQGDGMRCLEMHFLPDVYVVCEQCAGQRYNRETLEVRYGGRNIAEVLALTVDDALEVFAAVPTIASKLRTLAEVGLGYIHLGQAATTLSGGEAQRIKLATELSKRATGRTLYLLDEPTTGLHFADVHKLLEVLLRLRESGNTVVVIEHNLDVIKCADYIIDLGPEGGEAGGRLVVAGTPEEVARCEASHTGRFLKKVLQS